MPGASLEALADAVRRDVRDLRWCAALAEHAGARAAMARPGDLVLTLGAGSIGGGRRPHPGRPERGGLVSRSGRTAPRPAGRPRAISRFRQTNDSADPTTGPGRQPQLAALFVAPPGLAARRSRRSSSSSGSAMPW